MDSIQLPVNVLRSVLVEFEDAASREYSSYGRLARLAEEASNAETGGMIALDESAAEALVTLADAKVRRMARAQGGRAELDNFPGLRGTLWSMSFGFGLSPVSARTIQLLRTWIDEDVVTLETVSYAVEALIYQTQPELAGHDALMQLVKELAERDRDGETSAIWIGLGQKATEVWAVRALDSIRSLNDGSALTALQWIWQQGWLDFARLLPLLTELSRKFDGVPYGSFLLRAASHVTGGRSDLADDLAQWAREQPPDVLSEEMRAFLAADLPKLCARDRPRKSRIPGFVEWEPDWKNNRHRARCALETKDKRRGAPGGHG